MCTRTLVLLTLLKIIRSFRKSLLSVKFLLFAFTANIFAQQMYNGNSGLLITAILFQGTCRLYLVVKFSGLYCNGRRRRFNLKRRRWCCRVQQRRCAGVCCDRLFWFVWHNRKITATNGDILTLANGSVGGDVFVGMANYTDEVASVDFVSLGKFDVNSQLCELDLQANNNKFNIIWITQPWRAVAEMLAL